MNRERKPPISISEMKNGGKPPPQPGNLTYVETPNPGGGGEGERPVARSFKGKMNYTQLLIAVGLSVLAFLVISNFTLASKGDARILLDNQVLLESTQVALEGSVIGLQGNLSSESQRIENLISTQATYDSQLSGLSNTLSSLGSKITGVESSIASLDTRVGALEDAEPEYPVVNSLDYYLTEVSGDCKLHVTSSMDGIFIARVTLVYEDPYPIGDAWAYIDDALWAFYQNIGTSRVFSPELRLTNAGQWEVTSISFYTRGFDLKAEEAETKSILFYVPKGGYITYVEVLPGTVVTSSGEDNEI